MLNFFCVVGLSWLSCIRVRRLLFPDVLIFLVDLGGKDEWPDVGCLMAYITVNWSVDFMRLSWRA